MLTELFFLMKYSEILCVVNIILHIFKLSSPFILLNGIHFSSS